MLSRPLPRSPHFSDLAPCYISGLERRAKRLIERKFKCLRQGGWFTFGTGCSGTDIVAICIHALDAYLAGGDPKKLVAVQVLAVEADPSKQGWIKLSWKTRRVSGASLYADIAKLGLLRNVDIITGSDEETKKCFLFIAGFSCKELSSLNIAAAREIFQTVMAFASKSHQGLKRMRHGIDTSTTATFWGILVYLAIHRPCWFILENVLLVKRVLPIITKLLGDIDYTADWSIINSHDHGTRQHRGRIFVIGSWDHFQSTGSKTTYPYFNFRAVLRRLGGPL